MLLEEVYTHIESTNTKHLLDSIVHRLLCFLLIHEDRALEISSYVVIPTFATQLRENQTPEQKIIAAQTHFHSLPYMQLKDIVTVIQSYNDVIRELGERENVIVIETESEIAGTQEMFFDSVHFTDEGSKRLGRHIAKHVSDSNILK